MIDRFAREQGITPLRYGQLCFCPATSAILTLLKYVVQHWIWRTKHLKYYLISQIITPSTYGVLAPEKP